MFGIALPLLLVVIFAVVALRVVASVKKESAIFDEFNQSKGLVFLVLLFPCGPIALLLLVNRVGWLPAAVVAAACYLPALVISRQQISAFERSGTDRADTALASANLTFGASVGGLIYVAVSVFFIVASGSLGE